MFGKPSRSELEGQIKLLEQQRDAYKQLTVKLKQSEVKYRAILENIEESYLEVDLTGNFLFFNTSFCTLLGYSREELTGKNNREVLDKANAKKIFHVFHNVYATGKPASRVVWEIIRKDGRKIIIEASISLITDDSGEAIGFRGVGRDVTAQKKTEETLALNEARFRDISLSMADWIWETDKEGRYIFSAGNIKEVLGYDPDEILGKTPFEFMEESEQKRVGNLFSEIFEEKRPIVDLKNWNLKKDGSRVCLLTNGVPITSSSGALLGYRGVDKDITREQQAEEDLRRINKELKQAIEQARAMAQRAELANAAKSEFLANMSHEIRTPMNGIIGMTDLVLGTHLTGEQREYLEMAMMSANSLLGLINDILDFSKIEAGQMELESIDFNLRLTLEHAMDTLALKAHEKDLELICHIRPDVPTALTGDPGRLRQVVVNLAGNAIKFTEKGEVLIRVERESETDSSVTLRFMVSDTGIGIPEGTRDSIFKSFKQVDGSTTRKYGGTGLGLSISKQLVDLMGGEIKAESPNPFLSKSPSCQHRQATTPDAPGSLFHFTARFELSLSEEVMPPRLELQDLEGMPTLIVDDNATNRLLLQEILASWGIVPTTAADAREAMSLANRAFQNGVPYQLALLDMQMPETDGFALAEMMKGSPFGDTLKMIMLSSMGQKGDSKRCKDTGISGYLSKPVKQSELLDTILITMGLQEETAIITRHMLCELQERQNILLVEDNRINQTLAINLLKTRGHQVTLTTNGKEAVDAFETHDFDLILMDIQMPEMDGYEATRRIREMGQRGVAIPIVAMTAHAMKGDQEKCLEAGMDDYVPKPIKPETLFHVIEKLTRGAKKEPEDTALPSKAAAAFVPRTFDMSLAMETVLNDESIFCEIADIFLQDLPVNLEKIERSVTEKDAHALERAAHSLKGAVGNFGAAKAYEAAHRLEVLGKQKRLEMAADEFARLKQCIGDLSLELKLVVQEMNHEDSGS
ncbi:hypothetical protein DSLASN_43000 [Desulfoluna limicola]|uniref:histidine kinase n=1 Tax=Desulfoluna limicola TaxID=2810562 RepID=A0ABN6FCD7_9BACT|nr:response regulator [Desulfoluna limicola]BCS98668.1 hypothetical protein DSLASN_43000 [Desulfoluna limicola]